MTARAWLRAALGVAVQILALGAIGIGTAAIYHRVREYVHEDARAYAAAHVRAIEERAR